MIKEKKIIHLFLLFILIISYGYSEQYSQIELYEGKTLNTGQKIKLYDNDRISKKETIIYRLTKEGNLESSTDGTTWKETELWKFKRDLTVGIGGDSRNKVSEFTIANIDSTFYNPETSRNKQKYDNNMEGLTHNPTILAKPTIISTKETPVTDSTPSVQNSEPSNTIPQLQIGVFGDKNHDEETLNVPAGSQIVLRDTTLRNEERRFKYNTDGTIEEYISGEWKESSLDKLRSAQFNIDGDDIDEITIITPIPEGENVNSWQKNYVTTLSAKEGIYITNEEIAKNQQIKKTIGTTPNTVIPEIKTYSSRDELQEACNKGQGCTGTVNGEKITVISTIGLGYSNPADTTGKNTIAMPENSESPYDLCIKNENCEGYIVKDGKLYRTVEIQTTNKKIIMQGALITQTEFDTQSSSSNTLNINNMNTILQKNKKALTQINIENIITSNNKDLQVAYAIATNTPLSDVGVYIAKISDTTELKYYAENTQLTKGDQEIAATKYTQTATDTELKETYKNTKSDTLSQSIMEKAIDTTRLKETCDEAGAYIGCEDYNNQKAKTTINDLCEQNQKKCTKDLFKLSINEQDDAKAQATADHLIKCLEDNKCDASAVDIPELIYKANLDEDSRIAAATAMNGRNCDSFLASMVCAIFQDKTSRQSYLSGLTTSLSNIKLQNQIVDKDEITFNDKTLCSKGDTGKTCQEASKKACTKNGKLDKTCYDKALAAITQGSSIHKDKGSGKGSDAKYNDVNKQLINEYLKETGLKNKNNKPLEIKDVSENCASDPTSSACATDLNNVVNAYCQENPDKDCNDLLAGLDKTRGSMTVGTGLRYSFATALLNPDQGGLKAAKYFGFEANYSDVPELLKEDMTTSICKYKVDGYLDKTRSNNGGITSYGECVDQNTLDSNPDALCKDLIADIRGQRSAITPDNKTLITFSYYLRGDLSRNIKYIVAASYTVDGVKFKEILINTTALASEGTAKGFETVELPLANRDHVDPNSFRIGIGGFYESDRTIYTQLAAPIILASPENYVLTAQRLEANKAAVLQAKAGETLTSNDLLSLLNI